MKDPWADIPAMAGQAATKVLVRCAVSRCGRVLWELDGRADGTLATLRPPGRTGDPESFRDVRGEVVGTPAWVVTTDGAEDRTTAPIAAERVARAIYTDCHVGAGPYVITGDNLRRLYGELLQEWTRKRPRPGADNVPVSRQRPQGLTVWVHPGGASVGPQPGGRSRR